MAPLSGGQLCDDDDDYDIDDDDHDELWPFWPVLQARDAQQEGGPEQVAHQANQVGQAHCEPAYGHKGIPAHCGEAPNNGQKMRCKEQIAKLRKERCKKMGRKIA